MPLSLMLNAIGMRRRGFAFGGLGRVAFWCSGRGYICYSTLICLTPLTKKYAETDKPHVRMTELVVEPHRLDFVDIVTSTHNHTDHLDAETLGPLAEVNDNLQLVIPEANRAFVADRLGCNPEWPIGLTGGTSTTINGVTFHAVPAAHNELDTDNEGRNRYLGYVVQFGDFTVYHSGDTLWYDGMEHWFEEFTIDVAFLPINGNKPERRVAGNLNGVEAAQLAHNIGARFVIPCHFEMFEFNTASPDEFMRECGRLGQAFRLLQNGQRMWVHTP